MGPGLKYFADNGDIWVVSPEGVAMYWSGSDWGPAGGSRAMALEVFGDERAVELTDSMAAEVLARGGIPRPDFGSLQAER